MNFDECCVALIGDNISNNKRIFKLTRTTYVNFCSQKLALEARHILDKHGDSRNTLIPVHDTIKSARSGKVSMLERLNSIRED